MMKQQKVTYEGGFYPKRGRAGKEIRVDKKFVWGNKIWHIPAIYLCEEGMIVDICVEVEQELVKTFMNKWHSYEEKNRECSNAEYEQIQEENPLNIEFQSELYVNGGKLQQKRGCGVYWIPSECMEGDIETEREAKGVLEYYGYDLQKAWALHRLSYPWSESRLLEIKFLKMQLKREMTKISSQPFIAPMIGESYIIKNPVTGVEHTFIVREYEEKEMESDCFHDNSMEWPTKYASMAYTLFPEFDDFYLQDNCQGDSPRRKQTSPNGVLASSVGIVGLQMETEDKEKYIHPDGTGAKLRVCYSALYFERPEKIEWKFTFREKRVPDIEIQLI